DVLVRGPVRLRVVGLETLVELQRLGGPATEPRGDARIHQAAAAGPSRRRATGWSDAAPGRLVAYEGLIVGVLGALAGSGLGLLLVARFVPGVPADAGGGAGAGR